jgi:hypothetical protein
MVLVLRSLTAACASTGGTSSSVQMNCLLASKQTYIKFTLAWLRTCAGVIGIACQQLHPRAGSAGEAPANAEQSANSATAAAIFAPRQTP